MFTFICIYYVAICNLLHNFHNYNNNSVYNFLSMQMAEDSDLVSNNGLVSGHRKEGSLASSDGDQSDEDDLKTAITSLAQGRKV